MTKVQFAFQGGGAKLGALLAASEAVFTQRKALNYTISRVSGTSAGAIAACVLATGENPGVFRQRLINLASERLTRICKSYSNTMLYYHLWRGAPLYDTEEYRRFLIDLFDLGTRKWQFLHELDPNIEIFIHAVDVRTRTPKVYTKNDPTTLIADALLDSSALPFIFKTFRDTTGIFDGGLVNNFPSDVLVDGETRYGHVAGFSFRPQPIQVTFSGLKDFGGALISTMMDSATQQALSRLPDGDVHYIQTTTSTLDFQLALEKDLKGENYVDYVAQANKFLADFLARKRMKISTVSSSEIARRMMTLHDTLRAVQKVNIKKVILELKSNSLKVRNLADPSSIDDFYLSNEIIPETPVYTLGLRVAIEEEVFDPGDIKPIVISEEGNVGVTTLPISPDFFGGRVPDSNVILFFHRPLVPGKKYKITLSGNAKEILYDMISPKRYDSVSYLVRNEGHVDEIDLIAYIPESIPTPSLIADTGPLPQGLAWKPGQELSKDELSEFWSAYAGFYPIGWRSRNLQKGDATGFRAYNSAGA
jgi:predicted acylesterase/phospholipase RssA